MCPVFSSLLSHPPPSPRASAHAKQQPSLTDCYVNPKAVVDVPSGLSLSQFMQQLDTEDTSHPLSDVVRDFLGNGFQSLVVVGEAGVGKSTFCWKIGEALVPAGRDIQCFLDCPTSRLGRWELPWIPLVIELKYVKPSELEGLLPRLLEKLGIPLPIVDELRNQPASNSAIRLLVFCDGYDELARGSDQPVQSFVATLCGGEGQCWPASVLKVVFTSRPSQLSDRSQEQAVFGVHQRYLLLPLTKPRVSPTLHDTDPGGHARRVTPLSSMPAVFLGNSCASCVCASVCWLVQAVSVLCISVV